jgi:voltage-gated potassium channel
MIDSFSDHYIVCGFGRVGRQVSRDLRAAGAQHVVVDPSPLNRQAAVSAGVPLIESEPSDDEVLVQAGIRRAQGVIACVDSDAENIFITLTARELRSDIFIIARASAEDSEKKLLRAGADRVISPYKTSGSEMARVALRPQVGGAFDVADYRMEEIEVTPECEGAGQRIADVRGGSVIVAVRRPDGLLEPQPAPETVINPGDKLVALGTPATLERLESFFQPASVHAR